MRDAARFKRMDSVSACGLMDMIQDYSKHYGWFYSRHFEDELEPVGILPLEDCIHQIRRVLHVQQDEYNKNIESIREHAQRLKALGYSRCSATVDRQIIETAVQAGEKAFLPRDDHAYFICSTQSSTRHH